MPLLRRRKDRPPPNLPRKRGRNNHDMQPNPLRFLRGTRNDDAEKIVEGVYAKMISRFLMAAVVHFIGKDFKLCLKRHDGFGAKPACRLFRQPNAEPPEPRAWRETDTRAKCHPWNPHPRSCSESKKQESGYRENRVFRGKHRAEH